ncbi:MAG: hypothetical protein LBJ00_11145 [Planctomycetaceae bacterium]|jgi:hypothetical protein|nr:hypothetical protein [Planctomycetaceae bacterium]
MKRKLKGERKRLLKNIEFHWGYEAYTSEVHEILTHVDPTDFEVKELSTIFINKNWWEISDEEIEKNYMWMSLIGEVPFCYFLPALLCKRLTDNEFDDLGLIDFFIPPKKEHLLKKFEKKKLLFSAEQRKIICEFLIYMKKVFAHKETEYNCRMVKRISEAIENWSSYLE